MQVAGHLVFEVAHEAVLVALLPDRRAVEEDAPALFPGHALRDEAAPDVRHAERAVGGQVQEREGFGPPGRVLAVEGAPRARAERDATAARERLRQRLYETVDGVNVRVLVCEPLLNRTVFVSDPERVEVGRGPSDFVQRKSARPDVRVGEVAVDVDPAFVPDDGHGVPPAPIIPELFARDVVVVGLDYDARAVAYGEEVAEVLARVVARRAQAR